MPKGKSGPGHRQLRQDYLVDAAGKYVNRIGVKGFCPLVGEMQRSLACLTDVGRKFHSRASDVTGLFNR